MNSVCIVGRLGRDPELRQTGAGKAVASMSIAVDGAKGQAPDWFDVVAWDVLAETAARYLTKGRQVAITGRLQTRSWETPDGQKRKTVEIVAARIDFIGPRPDDGSGGASGGANAEAGPWDDPAPF